MATNSQILEGLWGLGYSNIQLSAIKTDGNQSDFIRTLWRDYGINATDVTKAVKLVDWRANSKASPYDNIVQAIGLSGVSDADYAKIMDAARKNQGTPGISQQGGVPATADILQAAKSILPPQVFTNVMIKAGVGDQLKQYPDAIQWNPMRGDIAQHPAAPTSGVEQAGVVTPTAPPTTPPPATPGTSPVGKAKTKTPATAGTPTGTQLAPGAGDKGLPANASDPEVDKYIRDNYGADAWMLNIPDLAGIVRNVIKTPGGWTQSAMDSAIQKTQWWKDNGQHVADYLGAQTTNPLGLKADIGKKQTIVEQRASANGVTLTPEMATQIATDWQKWGWDDNQVNATISQQFHYQSQGPGTAFTDRLKGDARAQLVNVDEGTIQSWGQKIIANPAEEVNFKEFLKNQAASTWPSFADRIKNGETMQQISAPYAATAGNVLELQPGDVDFTQPKWMSALDMVDDKGNHTHMSQPDWTRKLQTDSQYGYDYTNGAKQQAGVLATDILTKFGHMG